MAPTCHVMPLLIDVEKFVVLLQDNLVWYLLKQWYHPNGTKKERRIKGKKAKEQFEKAQGKAGHTGAVTSLVCLWHLHVTIFILPQAYKAFLKEHKALDMRQVAMAWFVATSESACKIFLAS